jgi:peptidyl-prolyl cis-trans isomerase D
MATFNPDIVNSLFDANTQPGTVMGPYIDANSYRAIKLIDRKVIADSVRSRHILRRVDANTAATNPLAMIQANATIDSLKLVLESGAAVFDSLAAKFSEDFSNANNGGDLGYAAINAMVQPYNEVLFYTGEIGKLYKVTTQFGVHLIEVLDRKFETNEERLKIAYVNQPIIPSEATQNAIRKKAREFVAENRSLEALRKAAAENDDLEVETAFGLKENDFIVGALGSGSDSRQIIKWAYKSSVGEVSPDVYSYQDQVNYFDNKYVVAALSSVVEPGMPSVADIKEEIELQVTNQKKAEKVKGQLSGSNLSAIASQYNTEIDTARNVSFTSSSLPGLGSEPKVLASAFFLELNQVSAPIIGNSGVYLLKVYNKPESAGITNIPQIRQIENSKTRSQVTGNLIQAMKKNANIEDYRSKFY